MKQKILFLTLFLPLFAWGQHAISLKSGDVIKGKITMISDSSITYQTSGKEKKTTATTISMADVAGYQLRDGVLFSVHTPKKDTIVSIMIDNENSSILEKYAQNQTRHITEALKTTGTVSLAVGVPCLAAGMASLMYANFLPNPMDKYTTSKIVAQEGNAIYVTTEEYNNKMANFSKQTHAAEVAGYILTPLGGALTIVGIPLYVKGEKMMQVDLQYTGNGAGVSFKF